MTSSRQPQSKAWHREPWPWIIIGLLGTTIAAGIITLWIAITHPDFLVVDETEYRQIKSEMRAQTGGDEEARPDPGDG